MNLFSLSYPSCTLVPRRLAAALLLVAATAAVSRAGVPASDITLQPPIQDQLPIFSPLTGYELGESAVTDPNKDTPLFAPYDAWSDPWWDNLVSELLQARISNVSFATRGASDDPAALGGGGMNPRRLYKFVDALNRAGAGSQMKMSCFVDSPSAQFIYNGVYGLPAGTLQNMADNSTGVTNHWHEIWWIRMIKPWFDTVPRNLWHTVNGRPRIEFWGLGNKTTNWQGNGSGMINYIASQMQATYGVTPVFVGACPDPTFTTNPNVIGSNPWFATPNTPFRFTRDTETGHTHGTIVPGFVDPNFFNPTHANYQNWNRVIKRNKVDGSGANGDTFRDALEAAFTSGCRFNLIEGWTNFYESAGVYRTVGSYFGTWDYPNQYINMIRPYTDLRTVTLRLEAEGCDEFHDVTTGNSGGSFLRAGEDLDVRSFVGAAATTASSTLANYPAKNGTDTNYATKWIANGQLPQWLQYDFGSGRACAVNTYYITSAENAPERDPSAWYLQGSSDGVNWTTLDSRSGQVFAARRRSNAYTFTNTTPYRYYRLTVTAAAAGPTANLQINDLLLRGGTTTGSGWAVTDTDPGEWVAFYGVHCSSGSYRFPIRYASTAASRVQLTVDGAALPVVTLPATGAMTTFDTAYLGTKNLGHGPHEFRVTFLDGGVDVDWIFVKKASPMVSFKSSLTNAYLTAELGGNSTLTCNRANASVWERFSANDLYGNGTLTEGGVLNLQGMIGFYLTAELGGGGSLTNNRRQPGEWEKFTLVKVSGSAGSGIVSGDQVALKSSDGLHFLTVVSGSKVDVSGTSVGAAQTFTVNLTGQ